MKQPYGCANPTIWYLLFLHKWKSPLAFSNSFFLSLALFYSITIYWFLKINESLQISRMQAYKSFNMREWLTYTNKSDCGGVFHHAFRMIFINSHRLSGEIIKIIQRYSIWVITVLKGGRIISRNRFKFWGTWAFSIIMYFYKTSNLRALFLFLGKRHRRNISSLMQLLFCFVANSIITILIYFRHNIICL